MRKYDTKNVLARGRYGEKEENVKEGDIETRI